MSISYLVGRFASGLAPGTVPAPAPVNGYITMRYSHILQVNTAPGTLIPVTPVRLAIVDGVLVGPDGVPSTTTPIPVQATDDPALAQTGDVFAQLDIVFDGGSEPVQALLALPGGAVVDIATASRAGTGGAVFVSGLTPSQLDALDEGLAAVEVNRAAAEIARSEAQAAAAEAVAVSTSDLDPAAASLVRKQDSALAVALAGTFVPVAGVPPQVVNPARAGVPTGAGTDATVALRALVASLPPNSTLACDPSDVYVLSGQVNLTKALRIERMTVSVGGYTGTVLNAAVSDVVFDGLTISGTTNAGTPVGAARFITASGTSTNRLSGVRVENCTLTNNRGTFIWLEWCVSPTVRRNNLTNGQYAGVMLISPKGGQVTDNTIRELLMTAPQVNAYGIAVTDELNVLSARAEDVLISGNYVEGVRDWEGIDTHGGRNIQIVNNTVRSCRTPIAVTTGNNARAYAPENCIVAGNFVEKGTANSETAGIVFNGKTGGTLPDRLATGFVGQNVVRGFAIDLIRDMTDGLRTTVTRQESDATTVASPDAAPYRQWIARATVTTTAGTPGGTASITFPVGKFSVPPVVQVTKQSGAGARQVPYATDISTTGCTIGIYDPSGGTTAATVAVVITVTQATETSAVGSPRG